MQSINRLVTRGAPRRQMSTVAAATLTSDVPDYVLKAAEPTVTKLGNGVTVASLYGGSGPSYTTTRITSVGSKHDKVGGESALLASAIGGTSDRDSVTLDGTPALSVDASSLDALKSAQLAKLAEMSPAEQMMDYLHETAYQGSGLGNFVGGTKETVPAVTGGDIAGLVGGVSGADVCVVGTGAGSHEKLCEEAEKAYGGLAAGSTEVGTVGGASQFIGSDVRIRYDSHNTATIAIGFKGASITDANALPLALMQCILGSYSASDGLGQNVASALAQEMAQHDLATYTSAFSLNYSDTGLFGVVLTAPDNKLDDTMWYLMPNLVRLAHGVSDEEMSRAKAALKRSVLQSYDGDAVSGVGIARQLQTVGRTISLAEMMARVEALTVDDVKAAGMEVINDEDHVLAAIGGIHELPDYNWIRRHSYMLRY